MIHDLLPKTVEGALTILGGWIGLIWSATLQSVAPLAWWFAIFVLTNLITGVWAGVKTTGFSSKALYAGMFKKGIAFAIIILAHGLDVSFWYVLKNLPVFQSVVLCAYCCGEFGSIVENIERAGYGDALPPALRKIFLTLEKRLENAVDSKLDSIGLDDAPKDKKEM
jgi:phage-related holin